MSEIIQRRRNVTFRVDSDEEYLTSDGSTQQKSLESLSPGLSKLQAVFNLGVSFSFPLINQLLSISCKTRQRIQADQLHVFA